jgi:hypothetical protein
MPVSIKLGQTTVVFIPVFFKVCNSCLKYIPYNFHRDPIESNPYVKASCKPTAANFDEQ